MKTVLFVAGGTGGHMYPAIAAARAIKRKPDWDVVFAVRKGDLGEDLLKREGFRVIELPGQGLPRRLSPKLLTFPFKLAAGFWGAGSAVKALGPAQVVGMGGYLSFPVLTVAKLQGHRTMIHEQNVYPGLANKMLGRIVDSIAVSFPESRSVFPKDKVWVSGLPVRPEIGSMSPADGRQKLGLDPHKLTVLIFGGSQGAQRINQAAAGAWPRLSEFAGRLQVLHVTGEKSYAAIQAAYAKNRYAGAGCSVLPRYGGRSGRGGLRNLPVGSVHDR